MLTAAMRRGYHVRDWNVWACQGLGRGCIRDRAAVPAPLRRKDHSMEVKLKLIGSTSPDIFEQRLNDFLASLDKDDIVVDVKFSTSPVGNQVEYNALVQYQTTDGWDD